MKSKPEEHLHPVIRSACKSVESPVFPFVIRHSAFIISPTAPTSSHSVTLSSLESNASEANRQNARHYDALGMAEYEAIESFHRWKRA